jgi:hypothetical protein
MALREMGNQGRDVRTVAEAAVDQDQRRLAVPGVLEHDLNPVRQGGPGAYDCEVPIAARFLASTAFTFSSSTVGLKVMTSVPAAPPGR